MCREHVYVYDGTFEGMLCCVYESFLRKEIPIAIESENVFGRTCFEIKRIERHKRSNIFFDDK